MQTQSPPPAQPIYVLAGSNVGNDFKNNALYIFDADAISNTPARVALPRSWARYLNRAPDGTLWVGLSGDFNRNDERVLVYTSDGALAHTLRPCSNPEAGITFAAGRVFVGCTGDGFTGEVAVLDATTREVITILPLAQPDAPLLLVGSGASADYVILTAMTTGPEPDRSYAIAVVIDAQRLDIVAQIELGPDSDVWAVLPHAGRFYLLNAASARAAAQPRPDVLVLDPARPEALERLTLPLASPLWGQIVAGELYAYHHPGWNTPQQADWRGVSRTALETGVGAAWQLEERFDAGGLAVWDGTPCLAHWDYWQPAAEHGLYCLEADGELRQRLTITDASAVISP